LLHDGHVDRDEAIDFATISLNQYQTVASRLLAECSKSNSKIRYLNFYSFALHTPQSLLAKNSTYMRNQIKNLVFVIGYEHHPFLF